MAREDDVQLIQDILSGNDAAFNALVQKHQKSVHSLVWKKISDFHYAEEITQDTFLQAYQKLRTLKDPRQFSGWLYVIANRLCIDWTRKQKPVMQSLWETPPKEIEKSCYAHYVAEKQETAAATYRHKIVNTLLDKLPENERRAMKFYYLDEMTAKEIGKFLGVSANTISSRLQRARKRLQTDEELQQVHDIFGGVQMSEKMIKNIKQQITAFRERAKSDPLLGVDILTEARNQVEDALKDEITPELVHLADEIYEYMGKLGYEKCIPLHRGYLGIAPNNEERFWSHSQLVSALAILSKNTEVIEEQTRLYRWTCEHLPDNYVLETLVHLHLANCWSEEGRIDEWFQLYEEASERLESPKVSHYNCCDFLQTGAEVAFSNDRLDEALLGMEKLERLNNDRSCDYYFRFWLAVVTNRIRIYGKREEWERFDQAFMEVNTFIEGEVEKRNAGHPVNRMDLAWAAHDAGACMMWSKRHNEAKHLLQVAIDFNSDPGTHFYLAANTWASEKDREKTLPILKTAQDIERNPWNRDPFLQYFLEMPEFADVKDDKEFLKVLGQK